MSLNVHQLMKSEVDMMTHQNICFGKYWKLLSATFTLINKPHLDVMFKNEQQCFIGFNASCIKFPGDTPIYGLYRYVPRDRVWFLRFWLLKK